MIESLDEDDMKEIYIPPMKMKKERTGNCFHATRSGMRCLNMQKHQVKIGSECYDFCKEHFYATLLKLCNILVNPIEVAREDITGVKNIQFEILGVECWNLEKTEMLFEFYTRPNQKLFLSIGNKSQSREQSSMSELLSKVEMLLTLRDGFILKSWGRTAEKLHTGVFENKVYGRFKGDRVKIPVDSIEIDVNLDASYTVIDLTVEIRSM
jgi:hypothetical protein